MSLRTQSLFPVAILTLLGALTFWLEHATQMDTPRDDAKNRHDPDYITESFELRRFGPTGALQNTLSGKKMVHYPDDDTTLLTEPRVSYFGGPQPTHVSANQGLVASDAREIALVGDVKAVREARGDDPATVLTTETLTVFPDDEIARTSAAVTIVQGASVVRGVGLDADNKTGIYKLLGQVRANIEMKNP
jgi:lipopolysaccharide export system protein LptC